MTVQTRWEGSTLIASLEGRMDSEAAPGLEKELQAAMGDARMLILDFSGVDYISSAGLRMLHSLQKRMGPEGKMKLIHLSDEVLKVLQITGFTRILQVE